MLETPKIDFSLRFFSERVFGAWVSGKIISINKKKGFVKLRAYFNGVQWSEKKSLKDTFYYDSYHKKSGKSFKFDEH